MKKYIYLVLIIALGLLPSCYDSWYVETVKMVGNLNTLPPNENEYIVSLRGEYGDMASNLIFFQIGRSANFSDGENVIVGSRNNDLEKNRLSGKYFYRICAISGNDTVFAPNVESFTVDHSLLINEPEKVEATFASLSCSSDIETGNVEIMISTDKEFTESVNLNAHIVDFVDGKYRYSGTIEKLTPGVTYYAKASIDMLLGTLESDIISFTTGDQGIKSVTIYGTDIDDQTIKDNLLVVIKNLTTQEWSKPYTAVYNSDKRGYDIQDFDYAVEPGTWYVAYSVTSPASTPTRWDSSGYVIFGDGDYQYGSGQSPISWGVAEIDGSNPYLKLEMRPWTAQIRVEYPARWGAVDNKEGLVIQNKNDILPGSTFNIEALKSLMGYGLYKAIPYGDIVLSDDGSTYSFTFNIFPTQLTSADFTMLLYLVNDKKDVPCPDLNIQMGKKYTISFADDGLGISDVTVNVWEQTEGGNITIKP